jgi:hypothetical protein
MTKDQNSNNVKCGQSCGCDEVKITEEQVKNNAPSFSQEKELPQNEPDPTRFGDWQVNGRAIDF